MLSNLSLKQLISEDLVFYDDLKKQMSAFFFDFVEEFSKEFTHSSDFRYILVPTTCHNEFKTYMENPIEKPIYDDHQHFHYIDPPMKPVFYRFCQVHNALPMCQAIHKFPPGRRLPINIIIEEAKHDTIPKRYLPLLLSSVEPSGLSLLLPYTKGSHSVHISQMILKHSQKLPLFIGNSFITNWLVQQGCPIEMLDTLWNNGFPLNFPLHIHDSFQKLYQLDDKVVEWCFGKSKNYPFDITPDHVVMNPTYHDQDHFPIVYHSLKNGYPLSKTPFSVLLKKTNLEGKDIFFHDYVIQKLKNDQFDMDMWAETSWQAKQDETIRLILEFSKPELHSYMVIHLCMNLIDVLYVDMDYWVLKLWGQYKSLMKFVHLPRFYKNGNIKSVDPRILHYLRNPPPSVPRPPSFYPPLYEKHPQTLIFYDPFYHKIEIPIYFSFLRSGLLSKITTPNTFFKNPHDTNTETITLTYGLPDIFRDQKKIMCDWIMYSYMGHIPLHLSLVDVFELYHLSQYLMDEECERKTTEWLFLHYMTHYENHMKHDLKHDCSLCSFWQNHGSVSSNHSSPFGLGVDDEFSSMISKGIDFRQRGQTIC